MGKLYKGEYDLSSIKWFAPIPKICVIECPCIKCGDVISFDLYDVQLEYPEKINKDIYFYCDGCDISTIATLELRLEIQVRVVDTRLDEDGGY